MHILAIHSFAVHGCASLKVMMRLLGNQILPVPSLYLTGLTNLPDVRKFELDFPRLLEGSLLLARHRQLRIWMYVGYLGSPEQVDLILDLRAQYADLIEGLIVDPVSGDHGRTYVPDPVIAAWPKLLAAADWAFPNFTEVQLHSGLPLDQLAPDQCLAAFQATYPTLDFVATSIPAGDQVGVYLRKGETTHHYHHQLLPTHFGGTGDVFATQFVKGHLLEEEEAVSALQQAADRTLDIMQHSLAQNSPDLLI